MKHKIKSTKQQIEQRLKYFKPLNSPQTENKRDPLLEASTKIGENMTETPDTLPRMASSIVPNIEAFVLK